MNAAKDGSKTLRQRLLTWLCAAVLLASALPLYLIALSNHPYYDDFGFSAPVHDAWVQTGSIGEVLRTALKASRDVRFTWQGTYTGTFLTNVQPGIFGEEYYYICTYILLTAFLLCFGFFLRTAFGAFNLSRRHSFRFSCLVLALMLQFMPDSGEAFFWYNGGVGNTFIYSLLFFSFACAYRLWRSSGAMRTTLWTMVLAVLMIPLGGGSYGGGLFGLCVYGVAMVALFIRNDRKRWVFYGLFLEFLALFIYSVLAPGNTVRAGYIGSKPSAVSAVIQALYYGVGQMGNWLRPALLAVSAMLAPGLYRAAKRSPYHFSHPWLALILLMLLYCAQLVPPLYAGVFIGGGRIVDTYFESFVLMETLYLYYLLGWLSKRAEAPDTLPGALRRVLAAASAVLLVIGCLAFKPTEEALYGAQNLSGVSATLSIVTGEAKRYDREMEAREVLLNDIAQPEISLSPLTSVPAVFMKDLLAPDAADDVVPALKKYYHKQSIIVEGREETP